MTSSTTGKEHSKPLVDMERRSSAGSTSLRSRKKDQTRSALLVSADQLFEEKGYEATTLDEICARAGISLRTFFRYFDSKRDLALYENMRNVARLRELLSHMSDPGRAIGELEALYDFMAMEFEQNGDARRRLFRMIGEPSLAARSLALDLDSEERIGEMLSTGCSKAATRDARLVAIMLVGGIRRAVFEWARSGGNVSLRDSIADVFSAARRSGLLPPSMTGKQNTHR